MIKILSMILLLINANFSFATSQTPSPEEKCFEKIGEEIPFKEFKRACNPSIFLNMNFKDQKGATILHYASLLKRVDILNFIIQAGGDVNGIDYQLNTPLHVAARSDNVIAINILLKNGALIEAKEKEKNSPLAIAADYNSIKATKLLLEYKANVNNYSKWKETPFIIASGQGNTEILKILSKYKADIQTKTWLGGEDALHVAARNNHVKTVEYLLEIGFNINEQSLYKRETPLLVAIKNRALDTASLLLKKKAFANLADSKKMTPLHYATYLNEEELVKKLLSSGADKNLLNSRTETAYDIANNLKNKNLIKILK